MTSSNWPTGSVECSRSTCRSQRPGSFWVSSLLGAWSDALLSRCLDEETQSTGRPRASAKAAAFSSAMRSEEHTSELQSLAYLVCRLLLEKKKNKNTAETYIDIVDISRY